MEPETASKLINYQQLLKSYDISHIEKDRYLYVYPVNGCLKYVLHLSIKTLQTPQLLRTLLPVLAAAKISFRIISNQMQQYQLNAGIYGEENIGKVISIYPDSNDAALQMAYQINFFSGSFNGPVIPGMTRIGQILYTEGKQVCFPIDRKYLVKKRKPTIIGKYYIPVQLLKNSPKGNIYLAICIKHFAFKLCVVKQGKPAALDDQHNREMKDRLLWQKSVLLDITDITTPGYLDYFEEKEHSYLVMQHASGAVLFNVVVDIYRDRTWQTLDLHNRQKLLRLFINALDLVAQLHQKGYVHRDITDSNFMVLKDGTLCILDFELSSSVTRKEPEHPFLLGTFGYVAPEQLKYAKPDYKEDIYSLGALLCFLLTNTPPVHFITNNHVERELYKITSDSAFGKMIVSCLSFKRQERPSIKNLKYAVLTYLYKL